MPRWAVVKTGDQRDEGALLITCIISGCAVESIDWAKKARSGVNFMSNAQLSAQRIGGG
jgi:hypothetical protein